MFPLIFTSLFRLNSLENWLLQVVMLRLGARTHNPGIEDPMLYQLS